MNTEIFTKMRTTTQAIDPRRSVLAEPQSAMLDEGTFEGAFDPYPQRRSEVKTLAGVESPPSQRILDSATPAKSVALLTTRGVSRRITRFGYVPGWRAYGLSTWGCGNVPPLRGCVT